MKKTIYSINNNLKKGIAALLATSMVLTGVQVPALASNTEETETETESSAKVSGLVSKKVTLDLTGDDLREAALTAIRDDNLFDGTDYLGATSDSKKAIKEYEAFFNENPGLYVVDAPESVADTLESELDAELRIFVQKDTKMRKAEIATASEIASLSELDSDESTMSKDVEFRYGTEKDIILYEPSTNVDTLVNGGEDAYYREPEQDITDNSDYELTGKEKITFMFINGSDSTLTFTLKVDGVTYDKVEVSGRKTALKKLLAEAGTKKTEESTTAAETTTTTETTAETESTATEETTVAEVTEETTAAEVETTVAEADTETTVAAEETEAETESDDAEVVAEETEAEVEETEPETEATIPEKIAEAVHEAVEGVTDAVLGRMVAYADTVVGEGYEFSDDQNAPSVESDEDDDQEDVVEIVTESDATVDEAEATDTTASDDKNDTVAEAAESTVVLVEDTTTETESTVTDTTIETTADEAVETTAAEAVETTAAADTEETTAAVKKTSKKVASASELESDDYDDFAKELIAEAKEAVEEDKDAALENIKVAKVAQYTLDELGKLHYEAEIDGYKVDVFATKDAFEIDKPKLEVKKLYKPEENKSADKTLSDAEVKELKANNVYDNSQSLDIHFTDGKGNEIEPVKSVKVRITLSDEELLNKVDVTSLEVHHIKEEKDSTLKTEKVATKDDVKALDDNDTAISESDLEANAAAVAEGEESAVTVASAVAEFEVESFSTFTITWNYSDGVDISKITVRYVDESGNPIPNMDTKTLNDISFNKDGGDVWHISEYQGGITNYVYVGAKLNNYTSEGVDIEAISFKPNNSNNYSIKYYDANGKEVTSDSTVVTNKPNYEYVRIETSLYYDRGEYSIYSTNKDNGKLYYGVWKGRNNNKRLTGYEELGKDPVSDHGGENNVYYQDAFGNYNKYDIDLGRIKYEERIVSYSYACETVVKDIYLIYRKLTVPTGGNPEVVPLTASKKATLNSDGSTYTMTLSVTSDQATDDEVHKANVIIMLDTSSSMGSSRMKAAKGAIRTLGETLLGEASDNVKIKLMTFDAIVNDTSYGEISNKEGLESIIRQLPAEGSGITNWEAALTAANCYDFGNGNPVHIVFVSDGEPTCRTSANGISDQEINENGYRLYGYYDYWGYYYLDENLDAAKKAASYLLDSNKKLYTIDAYGDDDSEEIMKDLGGNYYKATDDSSLTSKFAEIAKTIKYGAAYSDVVINDTLTEWTASLADQDSMFTYSVGGSENDADEKKKLKSATFDKTNNKVTWTIKGEHEKLEKGATYSVSFLVWPKQEAYDALSKYLNDHENVTKPGENFVAADNKWYYESNKGKATVDYKLVKEETGKTTEYIPQKTIELDPEKMLLDSTPLSVEKKWEYKNLKPEDVLKDTKSIKLNLKADGVEPSTGIDVSIRRPESYVNDNTWNTKQKIYVSPGILVSKTNGESLGLPDSKLVGDYYLLENGHDYTLTEPQGNASFALNTENGVDVYHPMLVDGSLKNMKFSYKGNELTAIELINDNPSATITATNIAKYDTLKVYKKYTGDMAVSQDTTFRLSLFKSVDGEAYTTDVSALNKEGDTSVLTPVKNNGEDVPGQYDFTISAGKLDEYKSITLTLPAGIYYTVSEVKEGKAYSSYTTKCGKTAYHETEGECIEKTKLGSGDGGCNTVYFVNELGSVVPTGFTDNISPFVALAFAGIGSIVFLAYDFKKRRVFED